MLKSYQLLNKITKKAAYFSLLGICVAALFTATDIIMRNFFNKPILGSYEITQLIFAVTVFASFAYTQTEKGHINIVILLQRFPQKLKFTVYALTAILSLVTSAAVTYAAFVMMNSVWTMNMITPQHRIPVYPFYGFAGIMMALFTVTLLFEVIQSIMAIFREDYAKQIEKDWV